MAYDIKQLNADLKRDLESMVIKKRVTGGKATQVHGEAGKSKTRRAREDRRKSKQKNYSDGGW